MARRRPARRSLGRSRLRARGRQACRDGRLVRAVGPLELGQPGVEHAARSRSRVGQRRRRSSTAIAAPIAGSPRASAGHVAPAAGRQRCGDRPVRPSRPGVAGAPPRRAPRPATSGRWLIAATARSCSPASIATTRARHAVASSRTRSTSAAAQRRPGTTTHGRSTNRSASPPRSRPSRGRPSGGRRRTAGRPRPPARRSRAFVLATSVTTASRPDRRATARRDRRSARGTRSPGRPGRSRSAPRDGGLAASPPRHR